LVGDDVGGELPVVDKGLVEPRRLAVRNQIRGEVEVRITVGKHCRRLPGKIQARKLDAILQHEARLGAPCRIGHDRRWFLSGGNVAEVLLHQIHGVPRINIAGERQRCIRGVIVGAEEIAHLIEGHRAEVLRRSDRQPVIGMVGRKEGRRQCDTGKAIRPVLVILPPLVQHDVALVLELFARQRRQQIPHAIRLHPEGELQRPRRHDLPVVGPIGIGGPVQQSTRLLQRLEISFVVVLGAFEHQMLEQMRESGASRLFVLGTDVIPDIHRHHRQLPMFVDDHVESIFEGALDVRYFH
jgi:hypothetical protein